MSDTSPWERSYRIPHEGPIQGSSTNTLGYNADGPYLQERQFQIVNSLDSELAAVHESAGYSVPTIIGNVGTSPYSFTPSVHVNYPNLLKGIREAGLSLPKHYVLSADHKSTMPYITIGEERNEAFIELPIGTDFIQSKVEARQDVNAMLWLAAMVAEKATDPYTIGEREVTQGVKILGVTGVMLGGLGAILGGNTALLTDILANLQTGISEPLYAALTLGGVAAVGSGRTVLQSLLGSDTVEHIKNKQMFDKNNWRDAYDMALEHEVLEPAI